MSNVNLNAIQLYLIFKKLICKLNIVKFGIQNHFNVNFNELYWAICKTLKSCIGSYIPSLPVMVTIFEKVGFQLQAPNS
jgi:hypothetical protein